MERQGEKRRQDDENKTEDYEFQRVFLPYENKRRDEKKNNNNNSKKLKEWQGLRKGMRHRNTDWQSMWQTN